MYIAIRRVTKHWQDACPDLQSTRRIRGWRGKLISKEAGGAEKANTVWAKLEDIAREVWTIYPPFDPIKG